MKRPITKFLKKAAIAAALAMMPAAALASEAAVVMLAKNGSTYQIALSDVDRISFNAATVELTGKTGQANSMAYADIDRILIGAPLSGLADLIAEGEIAVYPSVTEGPLTVTGAIGMTLVVSASAGTDISVYDLNGVKVYHTRAAGETLTLDLGAVHPGIMVVRIGGRSVKIIKK